MAVTGPAPVERWSTWVSAWTAVGIPGFCVAVLDWGTGRVVATSVAVAMTAALVLAVVEHARWEEGPRLPGGKGQVVRWIGRVVVCAVTFVVSTLLVAGFVPGAALLLLALAVATSPVVGLRRRVRGLRAAPPVPAPEAAAPATLHASYGPAEAASEMTDAELCRAWRYSFWTLREAQDPAARMAVVLQRQCFLDELEARNAPAIKAWLASGDRASGGPERFLGDGGPGDQPTAA